MSNMTSPGPEPIWPDEKTKSPCAIRIGPVTFHENISMQTIQRAIDKHIKHRDGEIADLKTDLATVLLTADAFSLGQPYELVKAKRKKLKDIKQKHGL